MAMTKCGECGADVSSTALACPKCGAPQVKKKRDVAPYFLVPIVLLIGGYQALKSSSFSSFAQVAAPAVSAPKLELVSYTCGSNSAGALIEGQVRNISPEKLDAVWVVASFYAKGGTLLGSQSSVIEFNPIMPGQTSPFRAYGPRNPAYSGCAVDGFKHTFGGPIETKR